jgi:hypothetical protein
MSPAYLDLSTRSDTRLGVFISSPRRCRPQDSAPKEIRHARFVTRKLREISMVDGLPLGFWLTLAITINYDEFSVLFVKRLCVNRFRVLAYRGLPDGAP